MPLNLDTRVTPSLHPDSVKSLEGFEDISGYGLDQTVAAFTTAYQGLSDMWAARDVVSQNSSWTEDRRIVELSKHADKKFEAIAKAFDVARDNLLTRIKVYEEELTADVVSKSSTSLSTEIRRHVKEMSREERNAFIQRAMDSSDRVSLSAVLGAPGYLSGLNADMHKVYVRQYRERMEPEKAKRLKVCQRAADLLMERGALVFSQLEKAVGAPPRKAAELRRKHEAATKVLA